MLSVEEYFKKFVYNADFLNAEKTNFDKITGEGNSLNNLEKVYKQDHFTESYFSRFDQKYNGMDWTSLKLVYKIYENKIYLVAIIHDQWTIWLAMLEKDCSLKMITIKLKQTITDDNSDE